MSDLLLGSLWSFSIAGLVLLSNSAVQLSVRKKTGPWKEGGASLLAGAIILGVSVFVGWLAELLLVLDVISFLLIVGLVLLFNGVVQLSVRKKTGPWKEGGASLLAGAIILGVLVFVGWSTGLTEIWSTMLGSPRVLIWQCFLAAGLVLLFNSVVQLCVRKKKGPWKEGGAGLLAGIIVAGVPIGVAIAFSWL
jgi:predicted phage tail protein